MALPTQSHAPEGSAMSSSQGHLVAAPSPGAKSCSRNFETAYSLTPSPVLPQGLH